MTTNGEPCALPHKSADPSFSDIGAHESADSGIAMSLESREFGVKSNLVYNQSELDLKNHKFVTRVKTVLFPTV